MRKELEDRFEIRKNGCWEWIACKNAKGYGVFYDKVAKRHTKSHRFAYEEIHGKIPDGLQIDHLCRNTSCCNPDHLEAVTPKENNRRGINCNSIKTHCKNGHPYSGDNLRVWYGRRNRERQCRICSNKASREYQRRKLKTHPSKFRV